MDDKTRKEIKNNILELLNDNPIISAVCKKAGKLTHTQVKTLIQEYYDSEC